MRIIYVAMISSLLFATGCHKIEKSFNLDFEDIENGLPRKWSVEHKQYANTVSLDSINVKSGKYAIAIELTEETKDFQAFTFKLPYNYDGKTITLSGHIKTENVTDGFAGLWLMTDSENEWKPYVISFMENYGVTGTNDWRKYHITLNMYPEEGNEISVGGLLTGKGKMWIDDLKVTIDGKNIQNAKLHQSKYFATKEDKEFEGASNVNFPELTEQKIDDLELLGKVWGFLKYHHPKIAKGVYNWDYELFRILPSYMNATDHSHRDKILLEWIKKFGKISNCATCQPTPEDAFLKPDISWIESIINSELKNLLNRIYINRNQGFNYYIKMRSYIENPIFMNELAYMGKEYTPDTGFRLLSLFRYWNIINYFYPYKHLTDKNWNSILKEYITHFIEAKSRLEYELISVRLIGEICDSHAFLLEGWDKIESLKGNKQIPISVKFIENRLVVIDAGNTDLRKGDIITRIDGKSIDAIVDSIKLFYPSSNDVTKMRDIASDILRSNKHVIIIEYISSGKLNRKEMNTSEIKACHYLYRKDPERCHKFISKNIGYIDLSTITKEEILSIKREFIHTNGIIIDVRNYPPDVLNLLAPFFISETTSFSMHTKGNIDNPGEFTFTHALKIPKSEKSYTGKLVVIVNEDTQSNAEYMAMAFRAGNRTTIIGSQTAGTDGNISKIVLPGGLTTYISGDGVYFPDGTETQRIGILPDIEIKPTIRGIQEGRDELLEKAIEIINQNNP